MTYKYAQCLSFVAEGEKYHKIGIMHKLFASSANPAASPSEDV